VVNIFLLVRVLSPFKMTTASNPTGDPVGRSNPTNRATPEGAGGYKATVDPQGNPVSIMVADHGLNRVQIIGHKAFAAGKAPPSSVQLARVPGVYPEVAGLKENWWKLGFPEDHWLPWTLHLRGSPVGRILAPTPRVSGGLLAVVVVILDGDNTLTSKKILATIRLWSEIL
jgi:hypothetical protein